MNILVCDVLTKTQGLEIMETFLHTNGFEKKIGNKIFLQNIVLYQIDKIVRRLLTLWQ